jgi:putative membrane-bound dehydrogenase-like protein
MRSSRAVRIAVAISVLTLLGLRSDRVWSTDLIGGEAPRMRTPEESLAAFTLAEGYEINLYASELTAPLHSPCAMTFDSLGRLWVTCIPSQPHAKPDRAPTDSVVVLEDLDRDGVAEKSTVFYDQLYLPMGMEVADGGRTVYVCDEPNLVKLTDTDGDLKADKKEIMLHGFGTEDNHHFISGFQWGPDGRLFFGQGLFLNTQVETPFGPVRAKEGAVFRLDPRNHRLEVFGDFGWSNVWGVVFDDWGQGLVADASPGLNYYLSHTTARFDYPKPKKYENPIAVRGGYSFTPNGRRPSCGNELISGEHFPEDVRGWYVTNQMKGWHGLRWYRLRQEGSGYASDQPRGEEELLTSTDTIFRPVAQRIGPDGALYVLDYYNPIVGHTTYNFRDPRHIKTHGRVWRITAKGRPLAWQPPILGEPVEKLLDLLKDRVNHRWRHLARRELQERDPATVLPALETWIAAHDDERDLTEALWICQGLEHYHFDLLKRLLGARSHDARTAAVRVLRYWQEQMPAAESLALLEKAVRDESQRVRLEAVVAAGFHADPAGGMSIAAQALDRERDPGFDLATRETLTWLSSRVSPAPAAVDRYLLPHIEDATLLSRALDADVSREILRRPSLDPGKHRDALAWLGEKAGRDGLDELINELGSAAGLDAETLGVLNARLLDWPAAEVTPRAEAIGRLAASASAPVRSHAAAVRMRLGTPPDAGAPPLDLLAAARLAGRGRVPEGLRGTIIGLTDAAQPAAVRLAAVGALPLFPAEDADSLDRLAAIADAHAGEADLQLSFAALEAMKSVPATAWPPKYANRVLNRVRISATPDLKFDIKEFTVKAGSAIELTFYNPDNMYHNLVLVDAGTVDRVGLAADIMAGDPDGLAKHYVPDDPGVLQWTPQLTIGGARSHVLRFYAPAKPGDYPYICTFPGHWRAMRGVMKVVE